MDCELASQLRWCLDASNTFSEASAAIESLESPVSGDYVGVPHLSALGTDSQLLVDCVSAFPFPFYFFNF